MRMAHVMMGPRDSSTIEGATVSRLTLRRVWSFARPYRGTIIVFLGAIIGSALLGLVPPFVIKAILDTAIPDGDRALITWLAVAAVAAALADGTLQVVQRWASSRVGEGLIYDMRRALFAKVQRMPIAFFTRTPTGALTSRLNNDVVGAQNAVTTTLGSVVSNVVVLVTSLLAMIALEWRLTLLALVVLPLFVIPAKRVGRRLQQISREQMQHNASMSTQMTERFNVAGAMLVKLFGDHGREDEQFEREARWRARRRHPLGDVRAGLLRGPRARRGHRGGGDLRRRRPPRRVGQRLGRHARRPRRPRDPGVRAADRADQRPRRPDDVARQLRARLRGARRAGADAASDRVPSTSSPRRGG